jgi:hypothetical protein
MKRDPSYDVFLSADWSDRDLSQILRHAIEERGLSVFAAVDLQRGENADWEDQVRSALADARVFVLLLTRSSVNSTQVVLELGAALGWGKSIVVLTQGLEPTAIPGPLARLRPRPITEIRSVLDQISAGIHPLTGPQAEALGQSYTALGVSTDQLATDPVALDRLTRRFNRATSVEFSAERVLQELIRLRKMGRLPRLKRAPR